MATRLYFPETEAAPVTVTTYDGFWEYTTETLSRKLADTKGTSAITVGQRIGPWTSGLPALDRQYVSAAMNSGIQFVSGSTVIGLQLMVREYSANDNVTGLYLSVRVVSEDGATVRATIRSAVDYLNSEFINNATHRNAGSTASCTSSYTTVSGDRLVVEIGYLDSGSTPEASAKWGENATDLPVNNTQTTDGAGWIEFSNTITFQGGNVTMQVSSGSFAITGSNIRMFQSYTLSLQSTSYSITGSNVNFTTGFRTELQSGSYLITGSNIAFLTAYLLQLQSGSYSITGSNVNFLTGVTIQLSSGTYQITGSNIRLLENPNIILQSGTYQITGSNVSFLTGETLQVQSGSFQITGSNVSMFSGATIQLQSGSFAITGSNINLLQSFIMQLQSGNYSITGSNVDLFQSYLLQLQSGNYSISGSNLALLENFYIPIQSGSFQITGSNINLLEAIVMQLTSGSYLITGSNVSFSMQSNILQAQSGSYSIQWGNVSFIYSQQQQPGGVKCCGYEIKTFSNELETQFGYTGAPGKTPKVDVFYNIDGTWHSAGVFTSIIIEFVEALTPDNYSYNIRVNHGGVATGVVKIW